MFIPIEFQKANEKTQRSFIQITANIVETCGVTESKFGGTPYFPAEADYPVDSAGRPMILLAQINFSEVPEHSQLPSAGLLQFYICSNDELYGANFDQPRLQTGFAIRFFPDTTGDNTPIPDINADSELLPIIGQYRLQFQLGNGYAGIDCIEYAEAMQANPFEVLEDVALNEKEEEMFYDAIVDASDTSGHKLLGYPYFTQTDPREKSNYQLLLQIDSDTAGENDIMWGDEGVANFFIKPADLLDCKFDDVWFNWDCH